MPEITGRLRTPRLLAPPTSPVVGEIYYNTNLNTLYWWDGVEWVSAAGSDGGATIYDSDQIGTVKAFAGSTIPTNWMLADGRSLTEAAYPQLAAALGVTGTFNLPNLIDKFIYGKSSAGWNTGGGEVNVTLSTLHIPSHNHAVYGPDLTGASDRSLNTATVDGAGSHSHGNAYGYGTILGSDGGTFVMGSGASTRTSPNLNAVNTADAGGHNHSVPGVDHLHTLASVGGGQAHNNMPPYVVMAFIIKVAGAEIDTGGDLVGPPGTPGEKWFSGSGVPSGSLATSVVGDWYLDGDTGDFYEKTGATTWTLRGNIAGTGIDVYEQEGTPTEPVELGSVWIDTDESPPIWSGLVWPPPVVSVLPAGAVDGQEVYFVADAAAGVVWHFRYRSAALGSYKWEYIGGGALFAQNQTQQNNASTTFVAVPPSIPVPLAGEYDFAWGGRLYGQNAAGQTVQMALFLNGVQQNPLIDHYQGSVASSITLVATNPIQKVRAAIAAGQIADIRIKQTAGTYVTTDNRFLEVRPVRVG